MANRYFNKQTTNARQALAQGGAAADPKKPKTGKPSIPEFPRQPSPDPKGGPRKLKTKNFDNTDGTNRKKIISDKIRRNKIKDRLDKLKEKMKAGPIGAGLNPDKLKKSIKNLKDQMASRQGKADGGRMNTSRMNRLEELGRVDSEKAYTSKGKRNLKDEKKRIVKEVAGK